MRLVSVDIGSTWTKGACFVLSDDDGLHVTKRAARPTTVDDLSRGFESVVAELTEGGHADQLFYSSSAKGGLAIAAIGIVPDLTAEMAKLTAYSAGAKITNSFAYELSSADISALRASNPDIILLAGGSDGGNRHYPIKNASALAKADLGATIVFAGNRDARDEVEGILAGHDLVCVENVLPSLECPNPEPARAAIRDLFLQRITKGKGLDKIIAATGREPQPTPYALFEYCRSIADLAPEFGEFMIIDMGGATTDVYSSHEEKNQGGVIRRGLPEGKIKRTVEGDLGMRVSARTAATAARKLYPSQDLGEGSSFAEFVEKAALRPETLTNEADEARFDTILASANIAQSVMRHSGRSHEVCTADGMVTIQAGRDLSRVAWVIGTGGYLAASAGFNPREFISNLGTDEHGKRVLAPRNARYLRDPGYLFPLLANIASTHPATAVRAGLQTLVEEI
ncbi:glutamate mutase L [Mesorhizobium sp.]|uniref:glutamate mutase L n=1 Tax=Mesorhizobium sp. TaxID=1871066 RepID=UPI000FE8021A|nr:glutamate mutase L [Mesorhizobium sp.]RWB69955.1 MAG: glutamate mutase [Mesorhizobium sp.]